MNFKHCAAKMMLEIRKKRKKNKASSFVDSSLGWIGHGCPRAVGWRRELEHLAKVKAGAVALVVGAPAEPAGKKLFFFKVRFGEMGILKRFISRPVGRWQDRAILFLSGTISAFRIKSRPLKSHAVRGRRK